MALPPKQPAPPKPGMVSANTEQFDVARRRAGQQENANLQAQKDALARRAAQTGGGVSGALIKQESLAADASGKRLADANEGINAQESGERARVAEINSGREFQTSERLGGQQFATSERLGGQGFAEAMQRRQMAYGTSEREAGQTFQAGQQERAIKAQFDQQAAQITAAANEGRLNREQADRQLAQLKTQFDQEMIENKKTNAVNTIATLVNSGKYSGEQIGALINGITIDPATGQVVFPDIPGVTSALPPAPDPYAAGGQEPRPGTRPGGRTSTYRENPE